MVYTPQGHKCLCSADQIAGLVLSAQIQLNIHNFISLHLFSLCNGQTWRILTSSIPQSFSTHQHSPSVSHFLVTLYTSQGKLKIRFLPVTKQWLSCWRVLLWFHWCVEILSGMIQCLPAGESAFEYICRDSSSLLEDIFSLLCYYSTCLWRPTTLPSFKYDSIGFVPEPKKYVLWVDGVQRL